MLRNRKTKTCKADQIIQSSNTKGLQMTMKFCKRHIKYTCKCCSFRNPRMVTNQLLQVGLTVTLSRRAPSNSQFRDASPETSCWAKYFQKLKNLGKHTSKRRMSFKLRILNYSMSCVLVKLPIRVFKVTFRINSSRLIIIGANRLTRNSFCKSMSCKRGFPTSTSNLIQFRARRTPRFSVTRRLKM